MTPPNFHKKSLVLAIALATPLASTTLLANPMLEEMIVTSARKDQMAEDIPYNITATTGDALERAGVVDFTKLARSTPGLTFTESGARDSGINSGLIIRGLNATSSGSIDTTTLDVPTVSTYVGEIPMFVNLHLKDIERVEIMRGPQGTLYGSGSLGGTIRYIHTEPTTQEFTAEFGSRISNTRHASGLNSDTYGVLNIPLSDTVAVRTVFGYVENQGFINSNGLVSFEDDGTIKGDPASGLYNDPLGVHYADGYNSPLYHSKKDVNDDNTTHLRVSMNWEASDYTLVKFTYQHQEDEASARQVANPVHADGDELSNTQTILESMEREVDMFGIDIETELDFAVIGLSASAYKNKSELMGDQNGVYMNSFFWYASSGSGTAYYDGLPREVVIGDYENEDEGKTVELRMIGEIGETIEYVAGAFWLNQKLNTLQQDIMPGFYEGHAFYGPGAADHPVTGGFQDGELFHQEIEAEYTDKAIFGEVTYYLNDEWQITGGARFFQQTFEIENDVYLIACGQGCSADGQNVYGYSPDSNSIDFNDSIFKLNTSYDITEAVMLYATWAEGFRHGGTNAAPFNNPNLPEPIEYREYDADVATNWEIGFKGRAFEDRMTFTATVFQIDWDDIQLATTTPNWNVPVVVNGGSAQARGAELTTTMYWDDKLMTTFGFSYTEAELTEDFSLPSDGIPGGGTEGLDGDKLPGVPELSVTLGAQYVLPLTNGIDAVFYVNGTYTDEVVTDLTQGRNFAEVDGYSVWDASISVESDQWTVTLFVDNATDERAPSNSRSASGFNVQPDVSYASALDVAPQAKNADQQGREMFDFIARPRTAGIGFTYKY